MKQWKISCKWKPKESEVAILLSDKTDFKSKLVIESWCNNTCLSFQLYRGGNWEDHSLRSVQAKNW
jgi:hypothetical protein